MHMNSYYTQSRSEMLPFIPNQANRLLDIGCGAGIFLEQLKKEKRTLLGIEMNTKAAAEAQKRIDQVFVGDVMEQLDCIGAVVDCISANDILEHLIDPSACLKKMKTVLADSGVVVASIPNVRYLPNLIGLLLKKDWEYTESGILDKTHLRFFTKKSIIRLFEDAGYSVEQINGINPIRSWKWTLFTVCTGGFFSDTQYMQFAVVAHKKS